MKTCIDTHEAPRAVGQYSQGVVSGEFLFCSGQIGIDPRTGELVRGDICDETRQACENLVAVLRAAGSSFDAVVKVEIYLTDMRTYDAMNKVYATFVEGMCPPARVTVGVVALPKGATVEIACVAQIPPHKK